MSRAWHISITQLARTVMSLLQRTVTRRGKRRSPVVDGAAVVIIVAWQLFIELAHTDTPERAVVRDDYLAAVVRGAPVRVVAESTEGWDAYAHTKVPKLRLYCLAEAWAPVALSEIKVAVFAAWDAGLPWPRHTAAPIAIAAAQDTRERQAGLIACKNEDFTQEGAYEGKGRKNGFLKLVSGTKEFQSCPFVSRQIRTTQQKETSA
jgi:hypothetical protein